MAILKTALRLGAALPIIGFGFVMPAMAEKPKFSGQNFVDQGNFNDRGGRGNRADRGDRGRRGDRDGRRADRDGRRGDRGNRGGGGQDRQFFQAEERIDRGGAQLVEAQHRRGRGHARGRGRGNFRGGHRGNFRGGRGRGFNRGFDRGFNRGFRQGRRQGFNRGFNRGFDRGFRPGFNRGFKRGFHPGFRSRGFYRNRFYGFRPYRGFNGYYGPRFRPVVGFDYVPAYAVGGVYGITANTIIINDFGGYGLYAPPSGYHWVCDKGSNDAILASIATGAIIGLAVGVLANDAGY
ncbi:MAG: RcnB family protein [Pseudomonadota bacterium]